MIAISLLLVLVLIALAAPRWGADTHRSGEWGADPYETWGRPDRPASHHWHLRS